jgi:hypothetical protein
MQCGGSANLTSLGGANAARDLFYCPVALRTSVLPNWLPTSQRLPCGMTVPPNRMSTWVLLLTGLGLGTIFQLIPSQCSTSRGVD